MRGRLGMNIKSPMLLRICRPQEPSAHADIGHILWYAPSTMVLVLRSGQYRAPRYFDGAHTEDHRVPYALIASFTEHHGKWKRAIPWCPVEYRVWCGHETH